MKRLTVLFLLVLCGMTYSAVAQKYACVNTEYILKSMPDYTQAQQRIDKYVAEWQREIEGKMQELETLRLSFQQEAYLLPDNLKNRRQQEIKTRDQEVRDLQRKYFAPDGELDKKRAEMLRPIQDRIYTAIERIAKEKGYAFVFDKAGSSTVLYVSEKYDITTQVLENLGVKGGAPADNEKGKKKRK
ncbi:MAG: OmpH family outer membrane protein [Bacteroidales bacterium]|nr:OmpH family outer membrane protein [Bacteroidales bacterium]